VTWQHGVLSYLTVSDFTIETLRNSARLYPIIMHDQ
jgi:hypothetical protein